MKVQVQFLQKGDNLGNCTIVTAPQYYGDYCGSKNRMIVGVQYGDAPAKNVLWGKYTTVTVTNR